MLCPPRASASRGAESSRVRTLCELGLERLASVCDRCRSRQRRRWTRTGPQSTSPCPCFSAPTVRLSPVQTAAAKRPTSPGIGRNLGESRKSEKSWTQWRRPERQQFAANRPHSSLREARLEIVVSPARVRVSPSQSPRSRMVTRYSGRRGIDRSRSSASVGKAWCLRFEFGPESRVATGFLGLEVTTPHPPVS